MLQDKTLIALSAVARSFDLDPAAFAAVAHVESGLVTHAMIDGRAEPLIRFEGHYFDRRLAGEKQARARAAGLASPEAGRVKNPVSQAARWATLARARAIDAQAADESTSWGIGQVMGAHWAWLGFASVDALVREARDGVDGQLRLMARYIATAGLAGALNGGDLRAFARGYNGPGFARNAYDVKLAAAHARYARLDWSTAPRASTVLRRGDRGKAVTDLQRRLADAGFPITVDGRFGPETDRAVRAFQSARSLPVNGTLDAATRAALESARSLLQRLIAWLGSFLGVAR